MWREVDSKNFYKALDHQGLTFKAADKKMITSKSLVGEIETLRREQMDKRLVPSIRPRYQFQFHFKDPSVFRDTNNVILSYLDKQSVYVPGDREKMESFIKEFVPQFYCLGEQFMTDDDVMMGDDDSDGFNASGQQAKQGEAQVKMEPKDDSMPVSGPRVPVAVDKDQSRAMSPSNTWIQVGNYDVKPTSLGTVPPSAESKKTSLNFFGNTTYYCFFRLYQLIYSRLETIKTTASELSRNASDRKTANPAAADLGLQDNRADVEADLKNGTGNYYAKLLALLGKLFDGEIDQQTFEESSRYIFATKAYIVFTLDKVIQALIKHVRRRNALVLIAVYFAFVNKNCQTHIFLHNRFIQLSLINGAMS